MSRLRSDEDRSSSGVAGYATDSQVADAGSHSTVTVPAVVMPMYVAGSSTPSA